MSNTTRQKMLPFDEVRGPDRALQLLAGVRQAMWNDPRLTKDTKTLLDTRFEHAILVSVFSEILQGTP